MATIANIKVYSADGTVQSVNWESAIPVVLMDGGGAPPFLGSIGYDILEVSVTPAITAGAYTAGDALGGLLTFANVVRVAGGGGEITKVVIVDNALQSAPVDLVLFRQTFTPTANNDPFGVSDADMQNCLGFIPVANTDYAEFANNCVATKASGLQMPFEYRLAVGGTALFGQLVIRIGDTFGAVNDITVKMTVRRYE
jgi:hypothetical protein